MRSGGMSGAANQTREERGMKTKNHDVDVMEEEQNGQFSEKEKMTQERMKKRENDSSKENLNKRAI
jgi:hypothetical protein